jgi:tetratricopeptide (TPR) repeat protein
MTSIDRTQARRLRRTRRGQIAGALIIAAVIAAAGGCGTTGSRKVKTDEAPALTPQQRLELAWELAEKADRARKQDDLADAASLYKQSTQMSGELSHVWTNYGFTLYELGDRLNAVPAYQRAAEAEPTDPRPYNYIAWIYYEMGWDVEGLKYYERSLAIDPNFLPSLRGAIQSAERLGRAEHIDLDRVRLALLIEREPKLREYLQRRQYLLEQRLKGERSIGVRTD